jgi:hypothetical protein
VSPAPADHFDVTTSFVNPDVAGTSGTVTITARDHYGNIAGTGPNTYEGTVNLATTDSQAAGLPSSHAFSVRDAGSYTFPVVILKSAGDQVITAIDSAISTLGGSSRVRVTAAAATQLIITTGPPDSVSPGQGFPMLIAAEDPFHNVDLNFGGNVTISLSNHPKFATTIQATNGIATFASLTLEAADNGGTIEAVSTGLKSASSPPIMVVPAPTIINEKPVYSQNTNKKGKLVGKRVFQGFELDYSTAMNSFSAGNHANYTVTYTTMQKVKKKRTPVQLSASFNATYNPSNNSVKLTITGKQNFVMGGQITVKALPPTGVKSVAGAFLDPNSTHFTILPNHQRVRPG